MSQRQLFDTGPKVDRTYGVEFNRSVPEAEKPRLSGQCRLILAKLREGAATNDELARIARKYTSRISDLRKAGYDVQCVEHDHKTGLTFYELHE